MAWTASMASVGKTLAGTPRPFVRLAFRLIPSSSTKPGRATNGRLSFRSRMSELFPRRFMRSSTPGPWPPDQYRGFRDAPRHAAIAVLAEFVDVAIPTDGGERRWTDIALDDPLAKDPNEHPLSGKTLDQELADLVESIEYRGGVLAEALMQRDDMAEYWRGLLTFSRESHPATFEIMRTAMHVGKFMAVRFKE